MKTQNIKSDLFEKSLRVLHVSASIKNSQEHFAWLCDILTRTENIESLESIDSDFSLFVANIVESIKDDLPHEQTEN